VLPEVVEKFQKSNLGEPRDAIGLVDDDGIVAAVKGGSSGRVRKLADGVAG